MLLTGLGLAYALPMVSLLSSLLTSCAEVEQEMVAVERVMQFTHLPRSPAAARCSTHPESARWFLTVAPCGWRLCPFFSALQLRLDWQQAGVQVFLCQIHRVAA